MVEFVHVCPQLKITVSGKWDLRSLLCIIWVCSATRKGHPSPLVSLHNNREVSSQKSVQVLRFQRNGSLPSGSHGEANAKCTAVSNLCQLEWGWYFSLKQQWSSPANAFSPSLPSLCAVLASQCWWSASSIRSTAGTSVFLVVHIATSA